MAGGEVKAVSSELANPLTPVLAAGAALAAMAGSVADAALVTGVVMGNGLLGGSQRVQADRAAAALLRQRPEQGRVLRDRAEALVLPRDLVRGDVVHLRAATCAVGRRRTLCRGLGESDSPAFLPGAVDLALPGRQVEGGDEG